MATERDRQYAACAYHGEGCTAPWGFLWAVESTSPGVDTTYVVALTEHGALRVAEAEHPGAHFADPVPHGGPLTEHGWRSYRRE